MHTNYADLEAGAPSPPPDTAFTPEFERCALPLQRALKRTRHDLAVLVLDERVEMGRAGNIAVIPARANFTAIPAGTTLRVAGFGAADGPIRRTRTAILTGYWDWTNIFLQDSAVFPDMVVFGDSGGPMYLGGSADSAPLEWVGDCADWARNWGAIDGDQVIYAPANHPGNSAFVQQFLEGPVDLPPIFEVPLWAGDWDTVGGAQDRDNDGLSSAHDNCPTIRNPEQRDGSMASPGTGNVSGVDVALDGVADFADCLGPILVGSGVI